MTTALSGFIAGECVSKGQPLGKNGEQLIWYGDDVNDTTTDRSALYGSIDAQILDELAKREGAVIMGRTTFDISIDGWGANPPIHKPCFVLSHRPAPPISRKGGTSFTFVTDIGEALHQAHRAANGRDVGVMGGAKTICQFLSKGLLNELHIHLIPVLLGNGIHLFKEMNRDLPRLKKMWARDGVKATHLMYEVI